MWMDGGGGVASHKPLSVITSGMDESHFTFMVFRYSPCKDNGQSHLVIRGRLKQLLSSPF